MSKNERQPQSLAAQGIPDDPLGYDTSDFFASARQMAENALSGKNKSATKKELERIRKRLGLSPK